MFFPEQSFTMMTIHQSPRYPTRRLFFVCYQWGGPFPSLHGKIGEKVFKRVAASSSIGQEGRDCLRPNIAHQRKEIYCCLYGEKYKWWTRDVSLESPSPKQLHHTLGPMTDLSLVLAQWLGWRLGILGSWVKDPSATDWIHQAVSSACHPSEVSEVITSSSVCTGRGALHQRHSRASRNDSYPGS